MRDDLLGDVPESRRFACRQLIYREVRRHLLLSAWQRTDHLSPVRVGVEVDRSQRSWVSNASASPSRTAARTPARSKFRRSVREAVGVAASRANLTVVYRAAVRRHTRNRRGPAKHPRQPQLLTQSRDQATRPPSFLLLDAQQSKHCSPTREATAVRNDDDPGARLREGVARIFRPEVVWTPWRSCSECQAGARLRCTPTKGGP